MLKPKKGRLLISEPSMEDSNFFRSVILLAVHNKNESVGFVLNQPTKIKVHHLIENFPKSSFPIYIGGPVERNSLHYVHTIGTKIEGSQKILDGLYWGGDFEVVRKMVENNEVDSSNIRFFAKNNPTSIDVVCSAVGVLWQSEVFIELQSFPTKMIYHFGGTTFFQNRIYHFNGTSF